MSKPMKATAPASAPAPFIPKPVGVRGSGPARLSDLSTTRTPEILRKPPVQSEGWRSKFFRSPEQPRRAIRDELVFDDGLTVMSQRLGVPQGKVSLEPVADIDLSPTSPLDAAIDSPSRSDPERDRQGSAFTSPEKDGGTQFDAFPEDLSSPIKGSLSFDKRSIPVSPSAKPTVDKRRRMLLSPDEIDCISSGQGAVLPKQVPSDTANWDSSSVHEDWSTKEEVVTPAAGPAEQADVAIVIDRKANDDAAKRIGQAWKAKWSFDAQVSVMRALHKTILTCPPSPALDSLGIRQTTSFCRICTPTSRQPSR